VADRTVLFTLKPQIAKPDASQLNAFTRQVQAEFARSNITFPVNITGADPSKLTNLNSAFSKLKENANNVAQALKSGGTAYDQYGKKIDSAGIAIERATVNLKRNEIQLKLSAKAAAENVSLFEKFGESVAQAFRRFGAFIISATAISGVVSGFRDAVAQTVEFNDTLVKLGQVTKSGVGSEGIQSISKEVTRLSTTLGVSSKELLGVSNTLAQAGLTAKRLLKLVYLPLSEILKRLQKALLQQCNSSVFRLEI